MGDHSGGTFKRGDRNEGRLKHELHTRLTILEKKVKDLESYVGKKSEEAVVDYGRQATCFLTEPEYDGRCKKCNYFCKLMISDKLTRFQFLWLLVIATSFFWFGIAEFFDAMKSENSKWKPRKLRKVVDYREDGTGKYTK